MRYFPLIFALIVSSTAFSQDGKNGRVEIILDDVSAVLYEQSHALVVGVAEYEENQWPDLPGVKKDVVAVSDVLEEHGFDVEMRLNLTKQQMDDVLSEFIAKYGQNKENRLLIYFAGHGHTINTSYGDKLGYIVLADSPNPHENEANFQSKAMEMAQFEIFAKRINSKHALFVFDACFSGSLFALTRAIPEAISYKTREPVRQFLTSGSEEEAVPDISVFREQFVQALSTDYSDADKDGFITGSELGEFLQTSVRNYTNENQHPQYGKIVHTGLDKGDFVFKVNNKKLQQAKAEHRSNQPSPKIRVIPTKGYGSIQLHTEIAGDLYVDGEFMGPLEAFKTYEIPEVNTGLRELEIKGEDPWSANMIVNADAPKIVKVLKSIKVNSFELASRGEFVDNRDGNKYSWIKIGEQIWTAENMKYYTESGSWCYEFKETSCYKYGRLYNYEMAVEACPDGWHLPTDLEWNQLVQYLGNNQQDGGALKTTGFDDWNQPNLGATNMTGFSALPGGGRSEDGTFLNENSSLGLWSSTLADDDHVWIRALTNRTHEVHRNVIPKSFGFSVRCMKDSD